MMRIPTLPAAISYTLISYILNQEKRKMVIKRVKSLGSEWIEAESKSGLKLTLSTCGAGVYAIEFKGKRLSLVLKRKSDFKSSPQFFGKTLARVAGRLPVDYSFKGEQLHLTRDEPFDCLHGGRMESLSFKEWTPSVEETADGGRITFTIVSPDGTCGFPGNVKATVTYTLLDSKPEFTLGFHAESDKLTPFSFSNHIYWNLTDDNDISDQVLYMAADRVGTDDGKSQLIDGLAPVPACLDFQKPTVLGKQLDVVEKELRAGTIDHTFVFSHPGTEKPQVTLENDRVRIECVTDMEATNIYVDNSQTDVAFKNGSNLQVKRRAIAIEPQELLLNQDHITLSPDHPISHFITYTIKEK